MKKNLIYLLGILLFLQQGYAQTQQKTWTEDFDGTVSFTVIPARSWKLNTIYHQPGSSSSNPMSYLGLVPTHTGDTSILQTPVYDCTDYDFVLLRFSHICKVSPSDIVKIEYRTNMGSMMGNWDSLPGIFYMGAAHNYAFSGFSAASYPEWQANDSTVFPSPSWWKEEIFDLNGIADRTQIQFRFVIIHEDCPGSQISYGWLLDNFQLQASMYQIYPPAVAFIPPLVKDTVYTTLPQEINARVRTQTNAPIKTPWLKYSAVKDGTLIETDSIQMIPVEGDSLWKASIKRFSAGTEVSYSVTGYDTLGNTASANSTYVIAMGNKVFVCQEEGGLADYYPFKHNYGFSRSMALYTAEEMKHRVRGEITTLALRVDIAGSGAFPMKIWLKTVEKSKTEWTNNDNLNWATLTQDAVLVYDGNFHFASTGWCDIPLDNTFTYTGTDNLVVMFEQNCTTYSCYQWMSSYSKYHVSTIQKNKCWFKYADDNAPTTADELHIFPYRPDLRLSVIDVKMDSCSVTTLSIDMADSVFVTPSLHFPVVVTLRNEGISDLDSVQAFYTVNGSTPIKKSLYFNPALAWDFEKQDTLGYYQPKVNGFDTITVWVSMPNGKADNMQWDDTLTKTVYGSSDIIINFVKYPQDTVSRTGPYEIELQIQTFSGSFIGKVALNVSTVYNGNTKKDTLNMIYDPFSMLWKTIIGQKHIGSDVYTSIVLIDTFGNEVNCKNHYHIVDCKNNQSSENYIIQDGSTASDYYPFKHNYGYSRSMSLYTAKEIGNSVNGSISKIAIRVATAEVGFFPMKIWLKTLPVSKTTWDETADNLDWSVLTKDATLVYDDEFQFDKTGWVDIPLMIPFYYTGKDNLVVLFEQNCENSSCSVSGYMTNYPKYYHSTTADDKFWFKYSDYSEPSTTTGLYIETFRPDLRIGLIPDCPDSNSVAMFSINSPSERKIMGGLSTPVHISIHNKGKNNLDSCLINWKLNGQLQPSTIYYGNLPEDFTDTISIGYYTPVTDKLDTVVVWVSMPNGVTDSNLYDDTLQIISTGCSAALSGTVQLAPKAGSGLITFDDVVKTIYDCGVSGDITLTLKGTYNNPIDLTRIEKYMEGYSLTITSVDNHPDSAIIQSSVEAGIIIPNMRNLTLKAITIDVTAKAIHALQFTGSCTNIVVRDCKLLTNINTNMAIAPVCKENNTGIADSIFFINNLLDGGHCGFYFHGGIGDGTGQYGTNIVFDNNTVSNSYYSGIYAAYLNYTSCSYNTISSRMTNTNTTWNAINMYHANGDVIGNRIIQKADDINDVYGIVLHTYNYYPSNIPKKRAIIANNEMIMKAPCSGIYANMARAEIINNSVYISNDKAANGIYIDNSPDNDMVIKNNNIVVTGSSAYPVYFSNTGNLNLYDIDYNNLYAPLYVGYYGSNISTIAAWQQIITSDTHSVSVLPQFSDLSSDLKFINYGSLLCNMLATVTDDVDKNPRSGITTMGCYEGLVVKDGNARLTEIVGLRNGHVQSQTDTVKVIIYNTGSTPLTSVNIEWSVDGISQSAGGVDYPVSLSRGQSDTVSLEEITYLAGNMDVKVWINTLNGGALVDEYSQDDTLNKVLFVCSGGLSGSLTVGASANSDFKTIEQVYTALNFCGITGDLIFALEPGIYTANLDFSNSASLTSNYTLTVTSTTNDANDVIIRPSSGYGINLSNTRNLTLKAITVDAATSGTNAIEFTGACTNILVRDCRLLANPTTALENCNPIYKKEYTGIVDSISFINNVMDGGYGGFYFYGGTSNSDYATNVVFDSNTVTNNYYVGIYSVYLNFTSCFANRVSSRKTNVGYSWRGITIYYANGPVVANRIIQTNDEMEDVYGIQSEYHNYYNTLDTAPIANNEIILTAFENCEGITAYYSHSKMINNSLHISGTATLKGISIDDYGDNMIIVKNNNIVVTDSSGYPVYFNTTGNSNYYNLDYNNYCAPNWIGYYEGNISTITAWQQKITSDLHSVSILPDFTDPTKSLELATANDTLNCPTIEITTDIQGLTRLKTTTMGAYSSPCVGEDLMLASISPWDTDIVNNQSVQVNVDLVNTGAVPITEAILGWSVNGVTQQPVSWTANPSLISREQRNIPVGVFEATHADTFDLVVWIETVNGKQDTLQDNDTLTATAIVSLLAEFVPPFIKDTVSLLSFDVSAKIRTGGGAPLVAPKLYIETLVNDVYFLFDSVSMVLNNHIWTANVPQQYYGSKVIYFLTVSDTVGNTVTLKDSVYIKLEQFVEGDSIIIGQGMMDKYSVPINMYYNYSWSRQIYLYREITTDLLSSGIYISKIAWQSVGANGIQTNQTCYMRAISDSVETFGYIDPLANGATQVWTGILNIAPGWVEITLDTLFFLPQNMNLEIFWEDQHGASFSSSHTWAYTSTIDQMTVYEYATSSFPTTSGFMSYDRPDVKIVTGRVYQPYAGNNLAISSFVSPVNTINDYCTKDSLPVKILIHNLGENDYDFSKDTVVLELEIIDPSQTKHSITLILDAGNLDRGMTDTVELMSALVVTSGKYELKAWLESDIDGIVYDDTMTYSYISGKIALPLDEDFSNNVFHEQFVNIAVTGSDVWEHCPDTNASVKPVFGTGMLRFVGTRGSMAQLRTRQLDLFGAVNPELEFWYYHDSTTSELDNSYTDLNIITDGFSNKLITLFKKDTLHGWTQYTIDLSPYTGAQCVFVQFEAMNKLDAQSMQYIDRILITSTQDVKVSSVIVSPQLSVCDLKNKDLYVVLTTVTNQTVDFSSYGTALEVEIQGYSTFNHPLTNTMQGNNSDTILVASNIDIDPNNNLIKAYLTVPVDANSQNDTATVLIDLSPALSATIIPYTSNGNCFKKKSEVNQEVSIINTGNADIPAGMELILTINADLVQSIKDTLSGALNAGDTVLHTFSEAYIVPTTDVDYQIVFTAFMPCDSAWVNITNAIVECIDIHDISIISIDNPVTGNTDHAGTTESIVISLQNTSDIKTFENVAVTALIEDENGAVLASLTDNIPKIEYDTIKPFIFNELYTVPDEAVYFLRVFLHNVDNYTENDTLWIEQATNVDVTAMDAMNKGLLLEQNIPNPADNSTQINYYLPEAGTIIFNLHSISGQLLYSETKETSFGKQSIKLNTSELSAGIYIYSIEYNGRRLVKRMSIRK